MAGVISNRFGERTQNIGTQQKKKTRKIIEMKKSFIVLPFNCYKRATIMIIIVFWPNTLTVIVIDQSAGFMITILPI